MYPDTGSRLRKVRFPAEAPERVEPLPPRSELFCVSTRNRPEQALELAQEQAPVDRPADLVSEPADLQILRSQSWRLGGDLCTARQLRTASRAPVWFSLPSRTLRTGC